MTYIAAQGPVPESVADFWRMIVQYSVQTIVMACNIDECGKVSPSQINSTTGTRSALQRKCEPYWKEGGELFVGGGVVVEQVEETTKLDTDLFQRFFRIKVPAATPPAEDGDEHVYQNLPLQPARPVERIVRLAGGKGGEGK